MLFRKVEPELSMLTGCLTHITPTGPVTTCPSPAPALVIVFSHDDPCQTASVFVGTSEVPLEEGGSTLANLHLV